MDRAITEPLKIIAVQTRGVYKMIRARIEPSYGKVYKKYFWVGVDEENEAISYVEEYVGRPVETLIFHSNNGNRDAIFSVIEGIIECKIGRDKDDPYINVETYKINKAHILEVLKS